MGESRANFNSLVKDMTRLKEISENASGDQLNVEKYIKELSDVCTEMFRATGRMYEQEHLRLIVFGCVHGDVSRNRAHHRTGAPLAHQHDHRGG